VALIVITGKAQQELKSLLESKSSSLTAGLRLGVSKGGCAGWQYEMKVAEPEAGDEVVESGGVRVIVAADSLEKLRGCELDYSDDLTDAGFKIHNPKARRSCGCGTSFEPEDEPEGSSAEDGEVCGGGGNAG
jgi:iron-sulfur cluster assembly protein